MKVFGRASARAEQINNPRRCRDRKEPFVRTEATEAEERVLW